MGVVLGGCRWHKLGASALLSGDQDGPSCQWPSGPSWHPGHPRTRSLLLRRSRKPNPNPPHTLTRNSGPVSNTPRRRPECAPSHNSPVRDGADGQDGADGHLGAREEVRCPGWRMARMDHPEARKEGRWSGWRGWRGWRGWPNLDPRKKRGGSRTAGWHPDGRMELNGTG